MAEISSVFSLGLPCLVPPYTLSQEEHAPHYFIHNVIMAINSSSAPGLPNGPSWVMSAPRLMRLGSSKARSASHMCT